MLKKLKWFVVGIFICIVGFGIWFLDGALPIGTGYSAKYLCSQVFVAGRNADQVFEKDVKPTHLLFRLVTPKINYNEKTVTSKAFGFWKPMTAVYREGCGCTLAVDTDPKTLREQAKGLLLAPQKRSHTQWPSGSVVDLKNLPANMNKTKITNALENAFTEPGPDTMRNTQAIVVVLGNRIIAEKYAPGVTPNTPMLGWSMCKSVTNTLVGILVKEGLLDLYSPAPVAEWRSDGDKRGAITLDMLMRMSSGLEFEEVYGPFKDATDMLYNSKSMSELAASMPLGAAPDTRWSYSSGTANIIARIVTDNTGGSLLSFYTFLRKRLLDKIHAYSAIIEPDASGVFVGSSYMFASARDWARFGLLLKNDGIWNNERILPKGWVKYSTTPTPAAPMGQYGAQFWLNAGEKDKPENRKFPSLPSDLYYCGGFNGQIVAVIPSRNMVIVRLGVTHDDSWSHESFIKQVLEAVQ